MEGQIENRYAEIQEKILNLIDKGTNKTKYIYKELAVTLCSRSYDGHKRGYKDPKRMLEDIMQAMKRDGIVEYKRRKGWSRTNAE